MMAFLFWHQILELEHLLWLDGVPTFYRPLLAFDALRLKDLS